MKDQMKLLGPNQVWLRCRGETKLLMQENSPACLNYYWTIYTAMKSVMELFHSDGTHKNKHLMTVTEANSGTWPQLPVPVLMATLL